MFIRITVNYYGLTDGGSVKKVGPDADGVDI
jgi:hypothetical protein